MTEGERKGDMKQFFYPVFAALVLTGCVSGIVSELPESHPANPQAQASPHAPATSMLVAGSQGLVLPVSSNQGRPHAHHQMQPATGAQKPAEHKHEHEQPKQEEKK